MQDPASPHGAEAVYLLLSAATLTEGTYDAAEGPHKDSDIVQHTIKQGLFNVTVFNKNMPQDSFRICC